MDELLLEQNLRNSYRNVSRQYREDDEIEVNTKNHWHLDGVLRAISASFGRPISVLDVGCGTGRYFHCLENVDHLVGVDLCPEMLDAARSPVRAHAITARTIDLLCQNVFHASFPRHTFDFIYSLGMFGNGCPVTVDICNCFHDWLAPGGKLFFDVIHQSGARVGVKAKRRLRHLVYERLPSRAQGTLDKRAENFPFFPLMKEELQSILKKSRFPHFEISRQVCRSPLWKGSHLECMAWAMDG